MSTDYIKVAARKIALPDSSHCGRTSAGVVEVAEYLRTEQLRKNAPNPVTMAPSVPVPELKRCVKKVFPIYSQCFNWNLELNKDAA